MIALKHNGTGSWLDPRSSPRLAAALSSRLWERCKGNQGIVLTLTYDRSPYANALDLYRRQSEERHVRLFIRRLERHLSCKLTGKWFCKMEFQRGGWVHFHMIILGVSRVPHADLTELWSHGFLSVKRLTPKAVRYCTKYVAKGGGIPAFLYAEPAKSIKIVRVSPGFWATKPVDEPDPEVVDDPEPDPYDEPQPSRIRSWVPIGAKIEWRWHTWTARDDDGNWARGQTDLGPLLAALLVMGCGIVGRDRGWLMVDATLEQLNDATAVVAADGGCLSRSRTARPGRRRRLDLIQRSNPHSGVPQWLHRWMMEDAIGGVV